MKHETNVECPLCFARRGRTWYPATDTYPEGYKCHACKSFTPTGSRRPTTKIFEAAVAEFEVPVSSGSLPLEATRYLRQYHFTPQLVLLSQVYWSESVRTWSNRSKQLIDWGPRLVFPYFRNTQMLGFEARDITGLSNAKWCSGGGKEIPFQFGNRNSSSVTVVEDVVSAHRVSQFCYAVPLRGTDLKPELLQVLQQLNKKVILWLDFDKAGRSATRQISTRLKVCKIPYTIVRTEFDPKCYTDSQLLQILEAHGIYDIEKARNK